MANIAKTYTLVNGQPADATQVNKNFDDIINGVGDTTTLRPTIASLGLDADLATLVLPANTTISAAGAELINEANAAAQIARLGAVSTGDARLSDARPASDVSAWAKAASAPAVNSLFNCGSYTGNAAHNRAISVGFQPKTVLLLGGSMIDTSGGYSSNGGAPIAGLVLSATGFVTANDDLATGSCNANTFFYHWQAWG